MPNKRRKRRELTEDAAWEIALRDHPEWSRLIEQDSLPDEITDERGEPMSPRAHLSLHAVVERQLASDEPKGVVAIARQLEQLGVSQHDIRHEIARAITGQMWRMMKEGCPFDEQQYLADLRNIVESHR
jgi:hypothetical protein